MFGGAWPQSVGENVLECYEELVLDSYVTPQRSLPALGFGFPLVKWG